MLYTFTPKPFVQFYDINANNCLKVQFLSGIHSFLISLFVTNNRLFGPTIRTTHQLKRPNRYTKWWPSHYTINSFIWISYTILSVHSFFILNSTKFCITFQLFPNDSKILDDFKSDLSDAKTFAKKINAIVSAEKQSEEQHNAEEEKRRQFASNQKLGLVSALLKVGDWKNAKQLIDKLPEYYAVSFDTIAKQLSHLIHFSIDKMYKQ